ncbi:unnamed protein product [Hyaloperonospora brassicae]|uniref:RlpA-like protein double-psi beta-barrel domain-containing protein n=1 Tax=Hyaloperonospora brassicae TaxID=162125 RepID=A0AAV0ULF7_HYABA|nr:unnamed protein product [Hyaloperonospora brassicae]
MVRPVYFVVVAATALLSAVVCHVGAAAVGDVLPYGGTATTKALGQAAAVACNANIGDSYAVVKRFQGNRPPVILRIVDDCPTCEDEGLDMAPATLQTMSGSSVPGLYAIRWEFVNCPATPGRAPPTYEAGVVEPATASTNPVSILQANEKDVDRTRRQEPAAADHKLLIAEAESSDDAKKSSGTSLVIVILVGLVAVGACALAVVFFTVANKKRRSKRGPCTTRSFDTFSSPATAKVSIVKF